MKIKTIQISGFRKILKATINMEDDITVIAGANNSGKTSKRYNVSVLDKKTKEEWTSLRKNDKLRFVIPQKADSCSIRTIVQHTSKNKTDFMYSVILNKLVDTMLPNYIEEGLMWLTN